MHRIVDAVERFAGVALLIAVVGVAGVHQVLLPLPSIGSALD